MRLLFVAALLAVLGGCGLPANESANDSKDKSTVGDVSLQEKMYAPPETDRAVAVVDSAGRVAVQQTDAEQQLVLNNAGAPIPVPPPDRQIIRKASLTLQVTDFKSTDASLRGLVRKHGAWIAAEQQTQSDERLQNVVEIKVPVAAFDMLMSGMAALPVKVEERKVESEDVTNAIVDSKGRIEAKKLLRARYTELMQRAQKMEDVLQVQQQIDAITEELESTTYNVKHMQAAAAYSSIYCTYYQPLSPIPGADTTPGFFTRLGRSLGSGGAAVLDLLIALASLWPLWLLAGLGWWAWRKNRIARMANAAVTGKAS